MNFNIGEVLSKAWQITWKFKVLWIFGILASCGRNGGGSTGGGSTQSSGNGSDFGSGFSYEIERFFNSLEPWMVVVGVIALVLLTLLIIFVVNFASTVGRIGLVNGTVKADRGAERLTWAELVQTKGPLFWRIFWFNLLAGLAIGIIALIFLLPLVAFSAITFGVGLLCLIPLICLLVPLSWLISVWLEQSNISMIVEESAIFIALRKAWEVISQNLGTYLVMAIILGLLGLVVSVLVILPFLPIAIPFLTGAVIDSQPLLTAGTIVSLVCFIVYLPILLLASGITTTYTISAWSLTYLRLTRLPSAPAAPIPLPEPLLEEDLPRPS